MAREKFERTKPHANVGTIGHVDHGKTGDQHRDASQRLWQGVNDPVETEMAIIKQHEDRTDEDHPDEHPARHFFGDCQSAVEGVTENDIAEDQHDHAGHAGNDDPFEQRQVEPDDAFHSLIPPELLVPSAHSPAPGSAIRGFAAESVTRSPLVHVKTAINIDTGPGNVGGLVGRKKKASICNIFGPSEPIE